MIKKFLIFIFFFFFNFNQAFSADLNIVYVDIDKIINQSIVGKEITKKLEALNNDNIKKFKDIEKKLIDEEKNIIKQKNILSKEDYEIKLKTLQKKIVSFRNNINNSKKNLDQKRVVATSKILDVLKTILSEYSSKNSISLIIQKENIVIGKSELEITNQVLDMVNNKIKTIELN